MGLGAGDDGHRVRLCLWGTVAHRTTGARAARRSARSDVARPTDLRDALRVKPGSRVRLEKLDAGATFGHDKAVVGRGHRAARWRACATSRTGSGPRRSTRCSSSSRASTPPARTARSPRSWRRSTRRAARSPRSRSRPPRSSPTTSCGGSTSGRPARARSASSTARTTRTCWSFACTTSCRSASGRSATTRSTTSSGRWRRTAPPSSSSSCRSTATSSASGSRSATTTRRSAGSSRLGDLDERKLWDDYQAAFDEALSKTSTDRAPWYVIPANRNWFRNLAVSTILADTMAGLKPAYPAPPDLPAEPRHRVGPAPRGGRGERDQGRRGRAGVTVHLVRFQVDERTLPGEGLADRRQVASRVGRGRQVAAWRDVRPRLDVRVAQPIEAPVAGSPARSGGRSRRTSPARVANGWPMTASPQSKNRSPSGPTTMFPPWKSLCWIEAGRRRARRAGESVTAARRARQPRPGCRRQRPARRGRPGPDPLVGHEPIQRLGQPLRSLVGGARGQHRGDDRLALDRALQGGVLGQDPLPRGQVVVAAPVRPARAERRPGVVEQQPRPGRVDGQRQDRALDARARGGPPGADPRTRARARSP